MTQSNRIPSRKAAGHRTIAGPQKIIKHWMFGLIAGTIVIGVTSPLFVRSYPVRVWDDVRQRFVYPTSLRYRWRSEGYASSAVGPHGMMGQTRLDEFDADQTIALWGDSQAEGVCVDDEDKLFSLIEQRIPGSVVLPFAVSGDDAIDWITQFSLVEKCVKGGPARHLTLRAGRLGSSGR